MQTISVQIDWELVRPSGPQSCGCYADVTAQLR